MYWKIFLILVCKTLLLLTLAGCQTREFAQAGISEEQRDADSKKCLEEARVAIKEQRQPAGATSDQIIVSSAFSGYAEGKAIGKYYRECMVKLGYTSVPLN